MRLALQSRPPKFNFFFLLEMIELLKHIDNFLISSHYNLALEGTSGASSLDPV